MLNLYKPEAAQSRPRIQTRSPEEEAAFIAELRAAAQKSMIKEEKQVPAKSE